MNKMRWHDLELSHQLRMGGHKHSDSPFYQEIDNPSGGREIT